MKIVVEIVEEGLDDEFVLEQLQWMEKDREAGGYLHLDGMNFVFSARIAGVARSTNVEPPGDLPFVFIAPLNGLEGP